MYGIVRSHAIYAQASISGIPVIPFLDLKEQRVIAKGAFGEVRSAKRSGFGLVVVKTTRAGSYNPASIGKELGFLRDVPPHTHVARVLGVCVDAPGGKLGIVMDYCQYGSLSSFFHSLPKVRGLFLMFFGVFDLQI